MGEGRKDESHNDLLQCPRSSWDAVLFTVPYSSALAKTRPALLSCCALPDLVPQRSEPGVPAASRSSVGALERAAAYGPGRRAAGATDPPSCAPPASFTSTRLLTAAPCVRVPAHTCWLMPGRRGTALGRSVSMAPGLTTRTSPPSTPGRACCPWRARPCFSSPLSLFSSLTSLAFPAAFHGDTQVACEWVEQNQPEAQHLFSLCLGRQGV